MDSEYGDTGHEGADGGGRVPHRTNGENDGDAGCEAWLERVGALPRDAAVVPEQWDAIAEAILPRRAGAPWWAQAAAAVILFAGGLAGGFLAATRRPEPPRASIDAAMELAAEVQRTGSEYVAALAAFSAVVDSLSTDARVQGRDAAIATLVGAASEMAGLAEAGLVADPGASPRSGGRVRF